MSGGIQWVLPSIDPEYREACLATLHPSVRERCLVLDNSRTNRGVARSWNLGRDRALNENADWLVLVSESMRFGASGGADWEATLRGADGAVVEGVCDGSCVEVYETGEGFCRRGYGWHLIAISTATLWLVGRFDEVFWPAWCEDSDFRWRLHLAGLSIRHVDSIDAHLAACEHSLAAGLVAVTWDDHFRLYEAKWGGRPGAEKFLTPYDDPALDLTAATVR